MLLVLVLLKMGSPFMRMRCGTMKIVPGSSLVWQPAAGEPHLALYGGQLQRGILHFCRYEKRTLNSTCSKLTTAAERTVKMLAQINPPKPC